MLYPSYYDQNCKEKVYVCKTPGILVCRSKSVGIVKKEKTIAIILERKSKNEILIIIPRYAHPKITPVTEMVNGDR